MIAKYSIKDIIAYRKLNWSYQTDFFYLTDIPNRFEEFSYKPDYYVFSILEHGAIAIDIDREYYYMKPNCLMIYRPDQLIKVRHIGKNTKGAFFLFTKGFIEENFFNISLFNLKASKDCFSLTKKDYDYLRKIYKPIVQILEHTSSVVWGHTANKLLMTLLLESNEVLKKYVNYSSLVQSNEVQIFNKFKELVLRNFTKYRVIEFYASELNISANYLYKIVKKQVNYTPTEILNKKLLESSQDLLHYSSWTISEIAIALHFGSLQSFSKFFKQQTGCSPSLYRKEVRNL